MEHAHGMPRVRCPKCPAEIPLDLVRRVSDRPMVRCPVCQATSVLGKPSGPRVDWGDVDEDA